MSNPKKNLAVFGATGNQGSSVLQHVLNDPTLSALYTPIALTRDPSGPTALAISAQGVQVRRADADDPSSLPSALKDVSTVFALTTTTYDARTLERELAHGRAIAEACYSAGVSFLIFSSLPSPGAVSGGKYTAVRSFEAKAGVETYIRSFADLGMQSAFFLPGSFMPNLVTNFKPLPSRAGDGSYAIYGCQSPESKLPWIDIARDTGRFVGPLLAQPEKYAGKTVCASSEVVSMQELAALVGRVSGKAVSYVQLDQETFGGFMPEGQRTDIVQMLMYIDEFGYYGVDSAKKVAKAVELTGGAVRSLEDWLHAEFKLQE